MNKTLPTCPLGALLLAPAFRAQVDDDHFNLRLGAMRARAETRFSARTTSAGDDCDYESDRVELGDKTMPRVEGMFRRGNRHRLLFNDFRYGEDRDYALDERIDLGGIGVPAGAAASLDTDFDLGDLVYDFAVIETRPPAPARRSTPSAPSSRRTCAPPATATGSTTHASPKAATHR